jgi:hypothetical protein
MGTLNTYRAVMAEVGFGTGFCVLFLFFKFFPYNMIHESEMFEKLVILTRD